MASEPASQPLSVLLTPQIRLICAVYFAAHEDQRCPVQFNSASNSNQDIKTVWEQTRKPSHTDRQTALSKTNTDQINHLYYACNSILPSIPAIPLRAKRRRVDELYTESPKKKYYTML